MWHTIWWLHIETAYTRLLVVLGMLVCKLRFKLRFSILHYFQMIHQNGSFTALRAIASSPPRTPLQSRCWSPTLTRRPEGCCPLQRPTPSAEPSAGWESLTTASTDLPRRTASWPSKFTHHCMHFLQVKWMLCTALFSTRLIQILVVDVIHT